MEGDESSACGELSEPGNQCATKSLIAESVASLGYAQRER